MTADLDLTVLDDQDALLHYLLALGRRLQDGSLSAPDAVGAGRLLELYVIRQRARRGAPERH